ncbi:Shedu anti-phage system protein SduA domain-containing protein [Nocardia takedensis]|uniref:Shedu anti-phage system protein SduA domain-containing protein n=1 Tax=Nocardia TaxID=1817 RepID=UPI002455703E|nr:Shedu anti-phage system protein SduA domain-containing protein [Nocardia farcinica]
MVADQTDAETAFRIWINAARGRRLQHKGAVIKNGPKVIKTVELSHYGSPDDGEVRKRELRFRANDTSANQAIDFDDDTSDKNTWFCENDEIETLLAFLHSDVARTGRYQVVDVDSPGAALLGLLKTTDVDPQHLVDALMQHSDLEKIVHLLTSSERGMTAAQSAILEDRRKLVARLRELVDNARSTETDVQRLIGSAYWIFGGRYVGVASRRALTMLDETDIPLLGADGTLHIVELKGPSIKGLIKSYRNHWIVGSAVHEATAQAMSYLRSMDEQGLVMSGAFRNELGQKYDMSRVFATVVIGHSDHHRPPEAEREVVARTLRQYTAGLNRIEVISYDQLVGSAERSVNFDREATHTRASAHDINL